MPILAPVYSSQLSMIATMANVQSLPTANGFCVGIIDMSIIRAMDVQLTVDFTLTNSVAASHVDIYAIPSHDGLMWGGSLIASTITANTRITGTSFLLNCQSAIEIAQIAPGASFTNVYWTGTLGKYMGAMPQFMAIGIFNETGYTFDAAYAHRVLVNYISYEYV